jgi:hypothetical protein
MMKTKIGIVMLLALLLAHGMRGTAQEEWKRFDAGWFSFSIPSDMNEDEAHAIDSYVGQFHNARMEISFDYGVYSNPLDDSNKSDHRSELIEIGGKQTKIVMYVESSSDSPLKYFAGVHFPDLGGQSKLTMTARCRDRDGQAIAKKIFESVRFKSKASED